MTSNHQTTNIVSPNFFPEIFSVLAVEKENKLFIGPKQFFFFSFGPIKSLFSFSTAKTEKNLWKKLGKTRLIVWWFDVTNKITDLKSPKRGNSELPILIKSNLLISKLKLKLEH